MKTIQVRRTRYAGHCWRSRDELISDVLQWTPTYGRAKAGRPARTYIQQLCEDSGCSPEDLPEEEVTRKGQGYPSREMPILKLLYIYDLNHFIINKGFVLFTPVNKPSTITEVVNSTGKLDLQQTQPELREVRVSSSMTLSWESINMTWAQEVQTNTFTGDWTIYKLSAAQHSLIRP